MFSCTESKLRQLDRYTQRRREMVARQLVPRGIDDPVVIGAMLKVPRHLFVPERLRERAYQDGAMSIGAGQTISQPFIVAFMTQALRLNPDDRVLEIGTGSGYQAAVLAEIVSEVYTVEIFESLAEKARKRFEELHYDNVFSRIGDGRFGWPENAPFDAVMITCAAEEIPVPIMDQLKEGGRLIIPRGPRGGLQKLVLSIKENGRMKHEEILDVVFVPMLGNEGGKNE